MKPEAKGISEDSNIMQGEFGEVILEGEINNWPRRFVLKPSAVQEAAKSGKQVKTTAKIYSINTGEFVREEEVEIGFSSVDGELLLSPLK